MTSLVHEAWKKGPPERGFGPPELLPSYLDRISRQKLLDHDQQIRLSRRAKAGDRRARNALIEKNLRFVVSVAKKYRGMGLPFEDLIQEGNIGLMKAVEKFDPDRGYRFSTCAIWWIRQAVQKAIMDKGRTIRVPEHVTEQIRRVSRAYNELSAQYGREPSEEQVAERLGWDLEEVQLAIEVMADATSLDQPVLSEKTVASQLGDFVEDERTNTLGEVVCEIEREYLERAIECLPERERHVLVRRYGLDGRDLATLGELGDELKISAERVRQLQRQAEQMLKTGKYSLTLRGIIV